MKALFSHLLWMISFGLVSVLFFLIFNVISLPSIIPCTYPAAQNTAIALCFSMILHTVIKPWKLIVKGKPVFILLSLSVMLILWLGNYPLSPLGYSNGQYSVLRGFIIIRPARQDLTLGSGGMVTMTGGSIMEIKPVTLQVDRQCFWVSANGGSLDDPKSCDVAYIAPMGTEFDTLKLLIKPACRLPDTRGEIKVSIFP
jgi:hypothetical protein